jgi:hypothetical protein
MDLKSTCMLLLLGAAFERLRHLPRMHEAEHLHRSQNGLQANGSIAPASAGDSSEAEHRNETHRGGECRRRWERG